MFPQKILSSALSKKYLELRKMPPIVTMYTFCASILGVTVHFSEIIELKFGKKMAHISCILKSLF